MNYIWIRLASPLQSWGGDAVSFELRPTNYIPTFSAILGFLGSCIGISYRKDLDKIKKIRDSIKIDIYPVSFGTQIGDYQGAGGGIKKIKEKNITATEDYRNREIPKKDSGQEAKVYLKEYLQDAKFDIILKTEDSFLSNNISNSLQTPKWYPFLGRKSCPLTEIPFGGSFTSIKDLYSQAKWKKRLHKIFFEQVSPDSENADPIKDFPLCLGDNTTGYRYVEEKNYADSI
jgi:CRISPR-associated protein Cas5/CasD, subtype I-E/ECOLI